MATPSVGEDNLDYLYSVGGNGKWKTVWQFLIKLDMNLPYNLATAFIPEKEEPMSAKKTLHKYSQQPLFIVTPNWKQLRYLLTVTQAKQVVLYCGILLGSKKKTTVTYNNLDASPRNYIE